MTAHPPHLLPMTSFGTGTSFKGRRHADVVDCVRMAWEAGFRSFDTAMIYGTEEALGEALRGKDRQDFVVTTKVSSFMHRYDQVGEAVDESLRKLKVDYVDFLLHHTPGPNIPFLRQRGNDPGLPDACDCRGFWQPWKGLFSEEELAKLPTEPEDMRKARAEVWRAIQDLKKGGKVRHIGVANYGRFHFEQLLSDPR